MSGMERRVQGLVSESQGEFFRSDVGCGRPPWGGSYVIHEKIKS
jgi:hypothetical protein